MACEESSDPFIEEHEIDFQGNLMINSRTINDTCSLFKAITEKRGKHNKISVGQLSELLVLLEAIATSNELSFDATVPRSVVKQVGEAERFLEDKIDNSKLFNAIEPASQIEVLGYSKESIRQCSDLLRKRMAAYNDYKSASGSLPPQLADVVELAPSKSKGARAFSDCLLAPLPDISERDQDANEIIVANDFNGAKCVAGIRSIEPDEGNHIREDSQEFFKDRSDKELLFLVPMFINTFRSCYLNILGSECNGSAFFAGPNIETLMSQQVPLLSSYVAETLTSDRLKQIVKSALGERFQSTKQFPFLGLLILLSSESGDPFSVFRTSYDDRDTLLTQFLAERSNVKRYVHDFTSEELDEFRKRKFEKIFNAMQRRVKVSDGLHRANSRFLLPALKHISSAQQILSVFSDTQIEQALTSIETVPEQHEYVCNLVDNNLILPGGLTHYASFTHNIAGRLNAVLESDGKEDNVIPARISQVLGCELVAS